MCQQKDDHFTAACDDDWLLLSLKLTCASTNESGMRSSSPVAMNSMLRMSSGSAGNADVARAKSRGSGGGGAAACASPGANVQALFVRQFGSGGKPITAS